MQRMQRIMATMQATMEALKTWSRISHNYYVHLHSSIIDDKKEKKNPTGSFTFKIAHVLWGEGLVWVGQG